jgi:hypothetical protein
MGEVRFFPLAPHSEGGGAQCRFAACFSAAAVATCKACDNSAELRLGNNCATRKEKRILCRPGGRGVAHRAFIRAGFNQHKRWAQAS